MYLGEVVSSCLNLASKVTGCLPALVIGSYCYKIHFCLGNILIMF
ncbi:unnamed protein product [Brassica oleracea]